VRQSFAKVVKNPRFCYLDAMLNWEVILWSELSRDDLYAILALRAEVFVVEQDCPYQDVDGKDACSLHVVGRQSAGDGAEVMAYARVVTSRAARGRGLGQQLMGCAIEACGLHFPGVPIRISAQAYLERFYFELGFVPTGKSYLEDNIPHLEMLRPAEPSGTA
jgi:ElaA protein